ncbi:carboxypeptidase-like regulatory domain-containing protein [Corallococcus sp. CA054B]|uniref:carboxypeptidase-like regulatory domain-containing protein n=1 Tax=Corallococcus sp. CA054B TaxID=2316734 RepID=UPI001F2EF0D8|nr:carboxypeptidase-like regulatory domain-containing protein [Corallococcus sp. CA054B]
MRWSWVGLVAVVLACAGTRPELETPGPAQDMTWMFRIVDPEGQPVSGARVNVWRADLSQDSALPGMTDAQGTGRVALKPGRYVAEVQARGFVTAFHTDIRIAPESKPRMELSLARTVPLPGRVVDTEGKPLNSVWLRFVSSTVATPLVQTSSDTQGRFTFEGVAAGEGLLYASKADWSWRRLKVVTPQPEITIVMGLRSSLLVRVVDTQGRVVQNTRSSVEPIDRRAGFSYVSEQTPEGTRHLRLPAQRYRVSASYAPSAGCHWDRTVDVDVPPGQQAEVTVSFEGIASAGPWTGRAVTADGKPLAGMQLRATALESPEGRDLMDRCRTRTGPDGYFELSHPLARPHKLELVSMDGLHQKVGVAEQAPSGPNGGPVVFQSPGTLLGRVLQPDGQPLKEFSLQGYPVAHHEGRFAWTPDASRPSALFIGAQGMAPFRLRVEARANEERTLPDITLDPGHTVVGQVLHEDGQTGVPNARVDWVDPADLEGPRDEHGFMHEADKAGRFHLKHLPLRPLFLRVNEEQGGTALYEVGAHEDSVELRLTADGELQGVVTDGARVPLAGVTVRARCEAGLDTRTTTDDAGHYVLRVPGDRECFVHVSDEPLRDASWPRPAPRVFSPQPVSLSPHERERRDFVPRSAGGALQVHFPEPRERLETFLVPGHVDMPKTYAALRILQRSAFTSDPAARKWPPEDPDVPGPYHWRVDFDFSHLPPGRYTFFAVDGWFGPSVLRVPVDVKQGEAKSLRLGFPADSGGTPLVP